MLSGGDSGPAMVIGKPELLDPAIDAMATRFRADHPFLFLIRDVESGLVLFLGRVADPSER